MQPSRVVMRWSHGTHANRPSLTSWSDTSIFCRNKIVHVNVLEGEVHCVIVPLTIKDLQVASFNKWLLTEMDSNRWLFSVKVVYVVKRFRFLRIPLFWKLNIFATAIISLSIGIQACLIITLFVVREPGFLFPTQAYFFSFPVFCNQFQLVLCPQ